LLQASVYNSVSIHAPARGATTRMLSKIALVVVSIHAPARGATRMQGYLFFVPFVSIHAPARGATGDAPAQTLFD